MELSVSMHAGSKKNAIKNLDKIKKIDEHNNRKYKNVNNKEIDPTLSRENITLRGTNNITNDVKELYKSEFTEAVCKYNIKQKDERRKIVDYLEKMNKDEKNNIAVEFIYQVGDAETWKGRSLEDKKKTKEIFEKAIDILEAKGIKVANATIHLDETSPHMHVVGVPIIENQKRGLEKQLSQRKVLTREVLKELREETEKVFIEEYKRVYKTNDVTLKKGSEIEEHLSVEDYKNTKKMLEVAKKYGNRKELKEEIEKKVDEVEKKIENLEKDNIEKSKKIQDLENENKNLTSELTNLEEKNYSLNTEVKDLETSKKTKEKDDIEKTLDLYHQKIKDYKEKIVKDKEDAIKLEEEQKKIEEDKKEQEKKNKAVKDEIDKKNKEYNDLLTEKNTLEEKKKKLDEEKQKIEDFYKNMETIITAEKEKMLKDVEDASIKLTEEKKKLEDANLELINANTELVNNNNALLKALETEKEKNTNITKEKEKIENENKEIEDSIKALKIEKTNLEADKIEISSGVKTLLENQKGYNDTLQLEYKKLENKKEVEKTADKNVTEIVFVVQGDFYPEAIYGKNYKSDYIFYNGDNIVDRIEGKEKDNLTYTVASAVYSVYGEEMKRTDLIYNTTTGKTDLIIDYLDYESEEKKTDTITFKEMKIDKFFTLVKEKLGELKETLIESIKQQFNYTNNHAKDMFTEEKNKKNIEKDDFEY